MAKYLLLKHYRGAPASVNDVPMDRWMPEEIEAHIRYMNDFAARLENTGEFVTHAALAPEGAWVRSDGEGKPPVVGAQPPHHASGEAAPTALGALDRGRAIGPGHRLLQLGGQPDQQRLARQRCDELDPQRQPVRGPVQR